MEQAKSSFAESAALRSAIGDETRAAMSLFNLSLVAIQQGDYDRYEALSEQVEAIWRRLGDWHDLVYVLEARGHSAFHKGQLDEAQRLMREARDIYAQWNDKRGVALTDEFEGRIECERGRVDLAEQYLRRSMLERVRMDARSDVLHIWQQLARTAAVAGEPRRSLRLLGAAAAQRENIRRAPGMESSQLPQQVAEQMRRVLGEAAADLAWAEGAAMSFEEATAYALLDGESRG